MRIAKEILTLIGVLSMLVVGPIAAKCCTLAHDERNKVQAEAVKLGFAEWKVDEYGNTTWAWKERRGP